MEKNTFIIILVLIMPFLLSACQDGSQIITKDFSHTMWKDDKNGTTLLFIEDYLLVDSGEIKTDMEFEDLKDIKYGSGKYRDIQIISNDDRIEIRDEEGLIMEFEKLSDDRMKDQYGTVFVKTAID